MGWKFVLGLALVLGASACVAPPSPAERLTDAARELNMAARFGRMDVAMGRASKTSRDVFLQRRASWGRDLRVLEIELAGLSMRDSHHAVVSVDVQWMRVNESSLRVTRLAQVWSDEDGSWQLQRERRMAGDLGLFGEQVEVLAPERRDAHFETITIR
ncbi:MAG: hypothetical protein OZ921_09335 [Sorangiineae bacterium]|nr:hypothetical protein [Polyangiaceae bacterium]MEB2322706.1 hypothetical protein [Sorangiineae bacterium]